MFCDIKMNHWEKNNNNESIHIIEWLGIWYKRETVVCALNIFLHYWTLVIFYFETFVSFYMWTKQRQILNYKIYDIACFAVSHQVHYAELILWWSTWWMELLSELQKKKKKNFLHRILKWSSFHLHSGGQKPRFWNIQRLPPSTNSTHCCANRKNRLFIWGSMGNSEHAGCQHDVCVFIFQINNFFYVLCHNISNCSYL